MLAFFIVSLVLVASASAQNSPGAKCNYRQFTSESETHTMCLPANTTCNLVDCSTLCGVSASEIEQIVKLQNDIREQVANGKFPGKDGKLLPNAANMRELKWNPELAKIAQAHAQQCTLKSDCFRCREVEEYPTGQNIYYQLSDSNTPTKDWASAIRYWSTSAKNLDNIDGKNYTRSAFTQMIWALTKEIGCGFARFTGGRFKYTDYYVCNYGPAGNNEEKSIYVQGNPCEDCTYEDTCCGVRCPSSQANKYPALCKLTETKR